ncbi:hypothetical protein Taro_007484 [Colocasia esculenta]|uniref:TLC domain-containing protein n=1 Tax=Colocasia esculenta TaxID=4460 RepID=A0A843TZU0_COLES|nr:hypothetical protein [Colocasia esculenta]
MALSLWALVLDNPFLSMFFAAYCFLYIFAYSVVFRNWSPKHRPEASSCFISMVHGTPAAVMAAMAILAADNRGFAAPNAAFQRLVLDYSIAYFTTDLLHYMVFYPGDYLFIGHHLATLFVFVTCRFLAFHGAFALLVLLVLAEVTSACQNVWTLAGIQKDESPVAAKVYALLSPPFYSLYTVARVLIGPLFFCKMSIFYITGKASDVIPLWVSLSWIIVVGAAISVSILWIMNHWLEFFRDDDKKKR